MSRYIRKSLPKDKDVKCIRMTKPSSDWERLGLALKETAAASIEEMRRQGSELAGRQLEQGARARTKIRDESESGEKKARRSPRSESRWV